MTLIVTRMSRRYVLMVTDRRVTRGGTVVDPDANKNIVFSDKNAVVAMAYTGMAYIGTVPTDQWIAQTLTDLSFTEGYHGPGTVPALTISNYEPRYLGVRVRALRDRLNNVRTLTLERYRNGWTAQPFDLLITGYEWNRGEFRPYYASLNKAPNSDSFTLHQAERNWYLPWGRQFPVQMAAAPLANVTVDDVRRVHERLDSVWGDGHGTPSQVADHAERLIAKLIQDVSVAENTVGPDTLSILIPPPDSPDRTIRIRYIPVLRHTGVLVVGQKRAPTPVAFTPWIISPGRILSPVVFTDCRPECSCGPYRVVVEGAVGTGLPWVLNSQVRPRLDG